MTSALIAYAIS